MSNKKSAKDERKIAIYSRKSKFTGKGESTHNQIEACKRKIGYTFDDIDMENDVIIYEDEGFSGYNTNRPAFQRMLSDIRAKKIKAISFYKLDRISRNVSDFSSLVTELELYDVTFISATESLENITPSGRAMMFMISVFAQFERDVIAERIRDNMIELAKTGRWLGGITPTGFKSEKIETITVDGKTRKLFKLSPVDEEKQLITLLFYKMLELKSLSKLETFAIQNDLQTKNGKTYSRWTLKNILTNPVYAMADENTLEYFRRFEVDIYADEKDFNGTHGLMVYNKTKKTQKRVERRDYSDWIIAIGKHKGFISGKQWVEVQNLLEQNSDMRYRKPGCSDALLSGILRCKECGSFMRPRLFRENSVDEHGRRKFCYMCELKDKSKKQKCQCKNVNGLEVDDLVLAEIKKMTAPTSKICQQLRALAKGEICEKDQKAEEIKTIKNTISKNDTNISSLLDKIKYVDVELIGDLSAEIKKLKEKNSELKERLKELTAETDDIISDADTADLILHILTSYMDTFDTLDLKTKRNLIKTLVSSITSDGETIRINFFGIKNEDGKNVSNRRESQTRLAPIGKNPAFAKVFDRLRDSVEEDISYKTAPTWKIQPITEESTLGQQIRYYRRMANIKQPELCQKLGCKRGVLNSIENDRVKIINIEILKAIFKELDIEDKVRINDDYISFLLNGSDKKIFTLRKSMNMTRTEFAEWLGISFTAIKHWENGYNVISRSMYNKIKHRVDN